MTARGVKKSGGISYFGCPGTTMAAGAGAQSPVPDPIVSARDSSMRSILADRELLAGTGGSVVQGNRGDRASEGRGPGSSNQGHAGGVTQRADGESAR